jgi:hypothetical protein
MNFTYYTIIGRDAHLLKGHLDNIVNYAGFSKLECDKKLLVVVYRNSKISPEVTEEIVKVCDEYGAEVAYYDEPDDNFLTNLYACWNLGYEKALDGFVFRGGSDQVFSEDSFLSLYDQAMSLKDQNFVLQANTIENADRNLNSRHIVASLGDSFDTMDMEAFESLCGLLIRNAVKPLLTLQDSLQLWNRPYGFTSTLGSINRTDGCSWLMKRSDWVEHGPLPAVEAGVTGDVVIHDRMQRAGYVSYITRDCITYHFVRGESKGHTQ